MKLNEKMDISHEDGRIWISLLKIFFFNVVILLLMKLNHSTVTFARL